MTAAGVAVRVLRAVVAFGAFAAFAQTSPQIFAARAVVPLVGGDGVPIVGRDRTAARAEELCRAAAQRTFVRAEALAAPRAAEPAPAAEAEDQLVSYLVSHPDLARSAEPAQKSASTDRVVLEQERQRVQAELDGLRPGGGDASGSDNPFADSERARPSRALVLKRRLAEIDSSLASVARARQGVTTTGLPELQKLIEALPPPSAAPSATKPTTPPVIEARLQQPPSEPQRSLLYGIGLALSLIVALLPAGSPRAERSASRRRASLEPRRAGTAVSRPPPSPSLSPSSVAEAPQVLSVDGLAGGEPAVPPSPELDSGPPPPRAEARPSSGAPGSGPPPGESPVMAYPTPWRPEAVPGRQRYYALREQLRALAQGDCFVVGVTATPAVAAAKAEISAGLAAAFAEDDSSRVLLVEADLAKPSLGTALGLVVLPATDFATQLSARVDGSADGHWYVLKCSPALHVLPSARTAPELILSTHFEDCVAALRPYYDVIIVNAPPLSEDVACRAVSDVVDGVVAAYPQNVPESARTLAPFSGERLGVVLSVANS